MDLSQLNTVRTSDDGAEVQLHSPETGKVILDEETKQPWSIRVLGVDSKRYQDLQHKTANKRINRRVRGGRGKVSSEEMDGDQLEIIVDCTVGWKHITLNGKKLDFTKDNVRMVYTEWPWIREQVEDFMGDRANYLGESSRNSKTTPATASN